MAVRQRRLTPLKEKAGETRGDRNIRWIEAGFNAAMGSPMSRGKRSLAVAKFALRYALLGLVIYAIVATRIVDLKAFLAGLFIFVVSIMWEAFRSALTSIRGGRS